MTDIAWPPWWERVGSRIPFWRREGLLLFPLGIIAVVSANASTIESGVDFLGWVLAALAGAACGLVFIGLFPIPFTQRDIPRLGPAAVIVAASGTGAVFALGVAWAARLLGLPDSDPLWWRVLGSAIVIGWFAIVLTLSLDARSRLKQRRSQLVDEAIALESARMSTTAIGEEIHKAVTDEVQLALASARGAFGSQVTDAETIAAFARWPQVAADLRATAAETVRPLSRQLWESASGDVDRPRPLSLLAYVVNHQPLRPLSVSVLFALGQVSPLLQQGADAASLVELIAGIAAIFMVMAPANWLMRIAPRQHALVFVSAALLLQVPVVLAYLTGTDEGSSAGSPAGMVATVIAGLIVILATSTFGAIRGLTQARLDTIATQIDGAFVESMSRSLALAHVLREASAIVHGSVQARLLGCAIAIEDAGMKKDPEQFSAALSRALDALENPLVNLGRPAATSLEDELSRRRELWEGLCDVTYSVSADVPVLPPATVLDCGRIVEEGISNAARHGDAQHVNVTIDSPTTLHEARSLRITITDDGHGLSTAPPRPGLGLRMVQSVAQSWELTTEQGITTLTVHVPLA